MLAVGRRRARGAARRLLHRLPPDRAAPGRADPRRAHPACRSAPITAFHKVAKRRFDDISSVAVAFALDVVDGVVAPGPHRARRGGRHADPGARDRGGARGPAVDGTRRSREAAGVLRGRGHADRRPPGQRRLPLGDARHRAAQAACRGTTRPLTRRGRTVSRLCRAAPPDAVVGQSRSARVGRAARHRCTRSTPTTSSARTHGVLHAHPVQAPHAHARVTRLRHRRPRSPSRASCGCSPPPTCPGVNDAGVKHDEPLFPDEVMFLGHAVCWVLGETLEAARLGARWRSRSTTSRCPSHRHGRARRSRPDSFQGGQPTIERGDVDAGLARRAARLQRRARDRRPGALLPRDPLLRSRTSTRAARCSSRAAPSTPPRPRRSSRTCSGCPSHAVTVQCLRMGGGFGGKEMQPHGFAAVAALGAVADRAPGAAAPHPHPGHHDDRQAARLPRPVAGRASTTTARLQALDATLTSDGGWSLDLSEPVLARALCHVDNAYWIPHVRVHGRIARTHKTSQTAFRGFGGPQGMLVIEDILGRCAPLLGIDPARAATPQLLRRRPGTPRTASRCATPSALARCWEQVLDHRRGRGTLGTRSPRSTPPHEHTKRALAVTPVKFGISFNFTAFNQAGALVHVYKDGSVLINHGGTEMGQGLHTKMLQVAATALGRAARAGAARAHPHRQGAQHLGHRGELGRRPQRRRGQGRLRADPRPAARRGADRLGVADDDVRFEGGLVHAAGSGEPVAWADLVRAAYFQRVQLWAAGFYRTEGLHWDSTTMHGLPVQVLRLRRRRHRGRGRRLHRCLPRCAASTSCTTSATPSRRSSTSARSRAASCRARAG